MYIQHKKSRDETKGEGEGREGGEKWKIELRWESQKIESKDGKRMGNSR